MRSIDVSFGEKLIQIILFFSFRFFWGEKRKKLTVKSFENVTFFMIPSLTFFSTPRGVMNTPRYEMNTPRSEMNAYFPLFLTIFSFFLQQKCKISDTLANSLLVHCLSLLRIFVSDWCLVLDNIKTNLGYSWH